ncbi:hypothetical protein PCK2_000406 [Pneumocystis canis]|nr:hypothetical protein PCK2_000406 [Pneumocystis canis]
MKDYYSYISGVQIHGKDLYNLRDRVRRLLQRSNDAFPGSQPVSFSKIHIQTLMNHDYYLCEKSDGLRALLYIIAEQDAAGKALEHIYLECVSKCVARYMDAWNIVSRTYIARIQRERQAQSLGLENT